jgi:hypothetical protein
MHMNRNTLGVAVLIALVAPWAACTSNTATPLTPTTSSGSVSGGGPGGTSLKASAPVAQSPANNSTTSSLTPALVVSGGALANSNAAVQYRFRIVNDTGTTAVDSGVQSSATWTPSAPLTPTSRYTWIARSEYQGLTGPWSATFAFTTPVAPGNDYGAWESTCQGLGDLALSACVWNFVRPTNAIEDLEVAKRVAWLLRSQGGGLLLKGSGETTAPWLGFTFSASRICFPDGHIYKIIGDAGPGGANTPGYAENGFVDVSSYFPARDPRLR